MTLTLFGKLEMEDWMETIVFRTSKEKLEITVQMKLGSQHSLEDCFLDEHDRVKGMKTINL